VTTTFQRPAVFPVRSKVQLIWVADTTVTLVACIFVCPDITSITVVVPVELKPVPTRLVILTVPVLMPIAGYIDVTVGAGLADTTAGSSRIRRNMQAIRYDFFIEIRP
jgi:hypothetical protein